MARGPRDYRAEYARRIERGQARGLSQSQARGHPRRGETSVSGRAPAAYDPRLEAGLKEIRNDATLRRAAARAGVAPERLRGYLARSGVAEKQGNRWRIGDDRRPRQTLIASAGQWRVVTVPDYDSAAEAGRHLAALGMFNAQHDPTLIAPFQGRGVRDVRGRWHPFETDPNAIYRLYAAGPEPFEQIYRIVV